MSKLIKIKLDQHDQESVTKVVDQYAKEIINIKGAKIDNVIMFRCGTINLIRLKRDIKLITRLGINLKMEAI